MPNELLLILSLVVLYGGVLLFYYLLGTSGMYCWTVFATVAANIEVLIVVRAFGMEQTLGNVLFASTFLVTDILSETTSKKAANRAVNIGILTSVCFVAVSQMWLLYTPSDTDWVMPAIRTVFANTPRLIAASLVVYAICQKFDVWAYHKWWALSARLCGDSKRFLWLRNNGSTLLSQLLNSVLFTLAAFAGMYDTKTLLSIMASTYVVFIFTSLLDTPVMYLARKITPRAEKKGA